MAASGRNCTTRKRPSAAGSRGYSARTRSRRL
jgi:hypothetical protein